MEDAYGSVEYWEKRHKEHEELKQVEWLCKSTTLRPLVMQSLHSLQQDDHRVRPSLLLLGCSNPTFPEELYTDGLKDITCLEASTTAAAALTKRWAGSKYSGLHVVQAAVQEPNVLPPRHLFQLVMDKGLIDCLLTTPTGITTAAQAIENVYERMATPGVWFSVSHSPPIDRMDFYTNYGKRYFESIEVKVVVRDPLEDVALSSVANEEVLDYDPDRHTGFSDSTAFVYILTK